MNPGGRAVRVRVPPGRRSSSAPDPSAPPALVYGSGAAYDSRAGGLR